MTDTFANQLALIVPDTPTPDGVANQLAFVIPLNETPPASAGANANQIVLICVNKEYVIPKHLHGWLIPAIWGDGYYIERGQMI